MSALEQRASARLASAMGRPNDRVRRYDRAGRRWHTLVQRGRFKHNTTACEWVRRRSVLPRDLQPDDGVLEASTSSGLRLLVRLRRHLSPSGRGGEGERSVESSAQPLLLHKGADNAHS
jgi:hypothetical protein